MVYVVMVSAFVMKDGQVWTARRRNVYLDVSYTDIVTMVLASATKVGMAKIVILVCFPIVIFQNTKMNFQFIYWLELRISKDIC